MRPNEPLPFKPEDIVLKTGDIVFIESRETELYYTGGLLPVGEFVLPRDYDLDVLEAVTQSRGPLFNGGVNFNNLGGNILCAGRRLPVAEPADRHPQDAGLRADHDPRGPEPRSQDPRERVLVKPGDFLILQETAGRVVHAVRDADVPVQLLRETCSIATRRSAVCNSNFPCLRKP